MSSMSWEDYLSRFVDTIRTAYEVELRRENIDLDDLIKLIDLPAIPVAFPKPCQITVFEHMRTLWIVAFEGDKNDKNFKVEKLGDNLEDFLRSHTEYERYREALELVYFKRETMQEFYKEDYITFGATDYIAYLFFLNPKDRFSPNELALRQFSESRMWVLRSIQRFKIEKSALNILNKVEKPSKDKAVLAEISLIRESIDKLKKIDEHEQKLISLEDTLVGVRRLVGTKGFGEWKVLLSELDKINTRIDALSDIKDAYDKVLAQQAEVLKQQSSFITWIKYATILVPIAVVLVPIIDAFVRHFLGIS